MRIHEMKRHYDAIITLGSNCIPAMQMQRLGLRSFSGPLDWMATADVPIVAELLRTRFHGFLGRDRIRNEGVDSEGKFYMIRDLPTQILSGHDFPMAGNTMQSLNTYDEVMAKLQRRIDRLYAKADTCPSLLFVRQLCPESEAKLLYDTLCKLVIGECKLVTINYSFVAGMVEKDPGIAGVCSVDMPIFPDIWVLNNVWWDQLFSGVTQASPVTEQLGLP